MNLIGLYCNAKSELIAVHSETLDFVHFIPYLCPNRIERVLLNPRCLRHDPHSAGLHVVEFGCIHGEQMWLLIARFLLFLLFGPKFFIAIFLNGNYRF